jgi:hypothetical protein
MSSHCAAMLKARVKLCRCNPDTFGAGIGIGIGIAQMNTDRLLPGQVTALKNGKN